MPAIIGMAEFIGCCLVTSAIAWLRHLRGAARMYHDVGVRYVGPVLMPILVVLLIYVGVDEQRRGEFHPDSSPPAVGLALGLGIVLSALVVWLVVEVRRFGVGPNGANRVHQSRPRNR